MRGKQIVGLDLEGERICAVQLRYLNRHKWKIEKYGKRIIEEESDTAQEIEELFQSEGISTKRIVASISSRDAMVKIISIPPINQRNTKKIDQMMQFEVERLLPMNGNEIVFDYQILRKSKDETLVLLAAARRDRLENYLDFLSEAGISPSAVVPSTLMFYNTLMISFLELIEEGVIVAVSIQRDTMDIVAIENRMLKLASSFSPRNINQTRSFESEIKNTVSSHIQKEIKRLILMTKEDELPSYIKMDTLKRALSCESCELIKADLEPATGLAMGYADIKETIGINLIKQLIKEKRKQQRLQAKQRALRLAPAFALLVFLLFSLTLRQWITSAQDKLVFYKSAQKARQSNKKEVVRLKKTVDKLQNQENAVSWAEPKYPPLSYRLHHIALATSKEIWLSEIEMPEESPKKRKSDVIPIMSTLYLSGYSPSQQNIDDFKKRLSKQDAFYTVKQEITEESRYSGERVLEFRLELKSKPVESRKGEILKTNHDR